MIEEQGISTNLPIKKIRLIENNIQNIVSRQPLNNKIRLLSKEEAQILREQHQNYHIQSRQQPQPIKIDYPLIQFPLIPVYNPSIDIPIIESLKQKAQVERQRSPRKEVGKLSQAQIDHYSIEILKAFQSADERRRQLQNRTK